MSAELTMAAAADLPKDPGKTRVTSGSVKNSYGRKRSWEAAGKEGSILNGLDQSDWLQSGLLHVAISIQEIPGKVQLVVAPMLGTQT